MDLPFIEKKQQEPFKSDLLIAPSILAGDFCALAQEARRIEESGADAIHIDVMDGHFVKNLTLGPQAVAAINRATPIFLDVHLMIYNPYFYVEKFVESGADMITFHFEATEDVEETLKYIKRCGIKAGLAFCPETSMSMIPKYLDKCDNILLMTVNPGFGGQPLIPSVLEKIKFTRELCTRLNIREGGITPKDEKAEENKLQPFRIQVDGGINLENIKTLVDAGANSIVAGTSLFQFADLAEGVKKMRKAAEN